MLACECDMRLSLASSCLLPPPPHNTTTQLTILVPVGTSGKTELCGTDGQSRNKGNGTQKEKKVSWHVPVPVTYASVVVSKKLAKIKSEVVDHQKNEINSKLILLSQSNS